ncbi:L,D-transpeptidase family protein [Nocardiopsis sp. HNM0947]|uniref:L,D-transpeptidase family protein n=1 Tax=Nocardiopsis coralli TaxID=2772213 RepID=A0ABR9P5F0_9ACTN|nr:Ig-like domain-containing protein [Nocardiopsis coralli]MBE2999064.1 L,D-transpeptidase family protein [Nocardiopsis coralli]
MVAVKGQIYGAGTQRTAAVAAGAVLVLSSCSLGGSEVEDGGPGSARVTVTPAPDSADVAPDTPVMVEAEDGTITDVRIEQTPTDDLGEEAAGDAGTASGQLGEDGATWISDRNLVPGASVTVHATAENDAGTETEVVSEFATAAVAEEDRLELVSNFPVSGDVVGVGMPVVINFDRDVERKEQVENSMEVTSEEPVEGAWNWVGDDTAVFRPKEYWEPYQDVEVDLRLAGVASEEGVHAVRDHSIEFEVGREQISTMHVPDHEMVVEVDGDHERTIPVSNGAGEKEFDTTTSGIHLTMEKYTSLVMDSATVGIPEGSPGHYRMDVDHAVRTSNSGEFTHAAPWNGQIGSANTSNGCTNMSEADARWFHDESLMGDVLETTGTGRELEWDNGWGFYQRSWEEWLDNSVTGEPQTTDGSGTPGDVHADET